MKRKHFKGMPGFITITRISCDAGIGMITTQLQAGVTEPAPVIEEEASELPPNWVDVTVGAAFTDGDKAAYQRRVGQDGDFYGGISDMHMESTIDDLTWTLDGHAMFGNEDYELVLGLEKDGIGYIEAGYREFRTWYDGSGGYLPIADGWFDNDDELSLDRGEVWFETGLRMEDLPEITFRYAHRWRDGDKDSTSWGGQGGDFKIAPSLNSIDEETDIFTLDVAHTLGNTDLGLGLRYQSVENEDTRIMGSDVDPDDSSAGNTVKDTAAYDSDLFNAHVFSESRFGERVMVSFGYSYTNLDTDIGGERPSRTNSDGLLETGSDHALWGISGGAEAQIHVINANLWWNPVDDLVVVPSFRAEFWDQSAEGWHIAGERGDNIGEDSGIDPDQAVEDALNGQWPTGDDEGYLAEVRDSSGNQWEEFCESVELRYNGIENSLLYASAEFTQSQGDYFHKTYEDLHDGDDPSTVKRWVDSDLDIQKYTIGANWYPVRGLSFAAQAYYRNYDQDLDNKFDGNEDAQINVHESETTDFNLRMTWRAMPNLTLVTRYDYQQTDIDNRGYDNQDKYAKQIQSADIESQIISQSVTWMPFSQMYVQGMVSYTMSETDTPANKWLPASVKDSDNDYLTANLTVGYSIDQRTDITAGYSFYYADNYALPATGIGYGTDLEEHVFNVRLNRWINPNMVWNLGYGYYTSNDGTSGGNNDFDAHMISTGLQVRF